MTNALGVAVIGAGMAGRAHALGYRSAGTVFSAGLPPVRLVSVADINEDWLGSDSPIAGARGSAPSGNS
jgi:predicted dehydrogenase